MSNSACIHTHIYIYTQVPTVLVEYIPGGEAMLQGAGRGVRFWRGKKR